MNKNLRTHLISALITFVATFAGTLLLSIDTFTLQTVENGAWIGIIFTALRTALKAVLQGLASLAIK